MCKVAFFKKLSWCYIGFIACGAIALVVLLVWGLAKEGAFLKLKGDNLSVKGIVWQLNDATVGINGDWDQIGADSLLVQWSKVNDHCYINCSSPTDFIPDWQHISEQPWAKHIILGLAGRFNEPEARKQVVELAKDSAKLIQRPLPMDVDGYYFPVEVDPSWQQAPELMKQALSELPRPLWISVYEGYNIGGQATADWLANWLPEDVGIFFQDGVGVEVRSAPVARQYVDALVEKFGQDRVKVIVEAFRPIADGEFRAATPEELLPQITVMKGNDIYLFDGPHYVRRELVDALRKKGIH